MTIERRTGLVALGLALFAGCQSPTGGDAMFAAPSSKKSSYKAYSGPPRTPLETARDGEDPLERSKAFKTLIAEAPKKDSATQAQDIAELQLSFQRERDPLMRAKILETLAAYPTGDVESFLRTGLTDKNSAVRLMIVSACAKRGEAGVPMLADVAEHDSDVDVKLAAARALGQIGGQAAVAALGTMLDDSNPAVQFRAMQALSQATGKRLGNDVTAWKSYVQSGVEPKPPTFVERLDPRRLF